MQANFLHILELGEEIGQMWQPKRINIRPRTGSSTGKIPRNLNNEPGNLELKHSSPSIHMDTCRIGRLCIAAL
jgi:hypothetical protein